MEILIILKFLCSKVFAYESKNVEGIKNLYGDDLIEGRRGIEWCFILLKSCCFNRSYLTIKCLNYIAQMLIYIYIYTETEHINTLTG